MLFDTTSLHRDYLHEVVWVQGRRHIADAGSSPLISRSTMKICGLDLGSCPRSSIKHVSGTSPMTNMKDIWQIFRTFSFSKYNSTNFIQKCPIQELCGFPLVFLKLKISLKLVIQKIMISDVLKKGHSLIRVA